jgi:5-hydroxyisourate hydrolase / 2-oxo-4-hydroxy-4-carboxy-5-ureidoimidazoline decarboxylase
MTLAEFNALDKDEAAKLLMSCCGSSNWVSLMMQQFPFADERSMIDVATGCWYLECSTADWLESFTHHPRIGDVKSLTEKFAGKEQAAVSAASAGIIQALADANAAYEEKFGFIFIVCATGKSAPEMLRMLQDRLGNHIDEETRIAMGEQHKITLIRFKKIFTGADLNFLTMSQVTTHVLDTSIGKPGKDIAIRLMERNNESWQTIAQGVTNADGRIGDLLPAERKLMPGNYKMVFETGNYFSVQGIKGFYPEVEIQFTVFDDAHYHVPLLINPFGYSTYRGS